MAQFTSFGTNLSATLFFGTPVSDSHRKDGVAGRWLPQIRGGLLLADVFSWDSAIEVLLQWVASL